jgi:small subunit ribosomal protein S20
VAARRVYQPGGRQHLENRIVVANIKQQKKRIRIAARQRLRNRQVKSALRTLFRRFDASVAEGDRETATQLSTLLARRIDKAASKGVIHKNAAARKKSLVARHLAKLS